MKNLFLAIVLVSLSLTAFAQPTGGSGVTDEDLQLNTITTALPFMSITPDSRAGAIGAWLDAKGTFEPEVAKRVLLEQLF